MVILKTHRTYCNPAEAAENSLTVNQLIQELLQFHPEEKVVFGGITYGQVKTIQREGEA